MENFNLLNLKEHKKNNLASTSVDTLPGIIFKISQPNSTNNLSMAELSCSSGVLKKYLWFKISSLRLQE